MPWARLDDDFHDNGKILNLSHQAFRLYVCAITYCRRHHSEGVLTPAQVEALCRQQRVNRAGVAELVAKHAWHEDPTGYRIHDFAEYQPRDDETAADRMRRYRARQKTTPHSHGVTDVTDVTRVTVTESDGTVTRNALRPVPIPNPIPVTTSPTERPTEIQTGVAIHTSSRARARETPYSVEFEDWWAVYPRHDAKLAACRAYAARLTSGRSASALLAAARHYAEHQATTPTEKIAHATTFLNQHRDEDWERGPPDADRRVAPNGPVKPSTLARNAAVFRELMQHQENQP